MPAKKQTDLGRGDYGDETWDYTPLTGAALDEAFHCALRAHGTFDGTDFVSFQPSTQKSQDRHVLENIEIGGRVWRLRCIFDGHAGHAAVDFIQRSIVPALQARLADAVAQADPPAEDAVAGALSGALLAIDETIGTEARALFPQDISMMSGEELLVIADDHRNGGSGANHEKLLRCKSGSTALVALLDPECKELWVASLGDCTAALCTRREAGGPWEVVNLSSNHNGVDPEEAARVKSEHPGEEEAMLNSRVVGTIAVTRALGDFFCKYPSDFVRRVLVASDPFPNFSATSLDGFLSRLRTPPYVSATPDVRWAKVGSATEQPSTAEQPPLSDAESSPAEQLLVMFSDGLPDCVLDDFSCAEPYLRVLPRILDRASSSKGVNLAAEVVRETLAGGAEYMPEMQAARDGEDVKAGPEVSSAERDDRLSQLVTLEEDGKWLDDVTVLVHRLL